MRLLLQVLKRKLQEGTGTFPVDAPVQDAAVSIKYSIHHATADGRPGRCVFHSELEPPRVHDATFTTGEGVMAAGVEMAIKLMLPGERSEVRMHPDFGFSTADEAPAGVPQDEVLVAVVELVTFDREGHPEVMDAAQVSLCMEVAPYGSADSGGVMMRWRRPEPLCYRGNGGQPVRWRHRVAGGVLD